MARSSALGSLGLVAYTVFAAAACSSGGGAPATTATSVTVPAPPAATPPPAASGSAFKTLPDAHTSFPLTVGRECRLPSPTKGPDACKADADCGPSEPCHAHACVAAAKAKPRGPNTMCTEIMDCTSTDANDCKCFEGRCSLVPRE